MSRIDANRLAVAAEVDSALRSEFSGLDPQALVAWASTKGYELTLEEAEGLSCSYEELSDESLEQVAGGWTEPGGGG